MTLAAYHMVSLKVTILLYGYTLANSEGPDKILHRAYVHRRIVCAPKIAFISLPINLNMCFGCSNEPSH